jgi:hypothetical protein
LKRTLKSVKIKRKTDRQKHRNTEKKKERKKDRRKEKKKERKITHVRIVQVNDRCGAIMNARMQALYAKDWNQFG